MGPDLAQIVISAVDKTGEAFTSVKTSMKQVELGGASLRDRLGDLVGMVSVGMFTAGIKSAIDYADKLNDLSQITGVSVEALDGLSYAAKTAGVDLEAVAKGVGKMQKALFDAAAGNRELSVIFGSLGVNAAQGLNNTEEALFKLADQFAKLPDGAEKSALAMKIFGKSGAELIPLLNQGGESLRAMRDEQMRWGGVSTETALRADAFNDTLEKLRMMSGALFREIASAVLPTLQSLANMFVESKEKAGGFREVGEWVNTGLKMMASLAMAGKAVFMMLGESIGGVGALIGAFFKGELFSTGSAILTGMKDRIKTIYGTLGEDIGRVMDAVPEEVKPKAKRAGESTGKAFMDALQKEIEKLEALASASWARYIDAIEKSREGLDSAFTSSYQAIKGTVKELEFQVSLIGQSSEEQERLNLYRKLDQEFIKGIVGQDEKRIAQLTEQLSLAKQQVDAAIQLKTEKNEQLKLEELDMKYRMQQLADEMRQNEQITGALSDALMRGFENGKGFAENFLGTLKNMFNTLVLRPIIQPIAQGGANWVQSLLGMSGNGGAGGGGGLNLGSLLNLGGSMAGGFGSAVAGLGNLVGSSTLSAFGAGMQGSTLAAGLAGPTTVGAGGAMGMGAQLGQFMSAAGPWVAAALAIYALHKAFGDKGENWKGQLGFGGAANAYTTQGIFGLEGFANLQGNDATNRSMQAFMAGTGGIDKLLAGSLNANQMSAIQAQLQGYNRRTDGQPAEFAFSKDDQTAAAQLTLEYLKVKYGAVFDQIDTTFADYVRTYTGKSEDLVKEIGLFADLIGQLAGTSIKGLNLTSLRAMQADGEELGGTLQRVAQGMAGLNSMFVDEGDAYLQALKLVGDEFASLGISLPVSADSFKILRDQIDFSTESGRAMYDMLVRVAPAMQQIDAATRTMMNGFNASMGQIFGSGYTRQLIELQAVGLVSRFQNASGLLLGSDPLSVFKSIGNQRPEDLQYIMSTFGPEVQSLLTQILQLYTQYMSVQDKVNDNTGSLGEVIGSTVDAFGDARLNLQKYLAGSLLNQQLSPLTLMQQKDFALSEFERLAKLAPGSVDAMNQLGSARDTYLSLLRQLSGSSTGYNAEFFRTFDITRGIAGGGPTWQNLMQSALPAQGARMASDQDVAALRQDIQQLTLAVLQGDRETADRIAAAIQNQADKQLQASAVSGPMGATV